MKEILGKDMSQQLITLKKRKGEFNQNISEFSLSGQYTNKPSLAFWTSSLIGENESAWTRWCSYEMPEWLDDVRKYILIPKRDLRILEISCEEDLAGLPKTEPVRTIGIGTMVLDFQRIHSLGFSGIHLTEDGASTLHFGSVKYDIDFNAWDMESTVWLEPNCFESVKELTD